MKVRRVVTGHTREGKAVVASDEAVDATTVSLLPGHEFHTLWGADRLPVFPDAGTSSPGSTYFPPCGGFRFMLFTLPPRSVSRPQIDDRQKAMLEMEALLPGLAATMEPDHPGMHRTDTVDFEYVISGEVWLELDDGEEVQLRAGDTVVQNGTRHAWRNRGDKPCCMVVCIIGTAPRGSEASRAE